MPGLVKYQISVVPYYTNVIVDAENCSGIEFVNNGNTLVKVAGMPIKPNGGSWMPTIPCVDDVDTTKYNVVFEVIDTNTDVYELLVSRKVYVDNISNR